jgi:hypothetical protein
LRKDKIKVNEMTNDKKERKQDALAMMDFVFPSRLECLRLFFWISVCHFDFRKATLQRLGQKRFANALEGFREHFGEKKPQCESVPTPLPSHVGKAAFWFFKVIQDGIDQQTNSNDHAPTLLLANLSKQNLTSTTYNAEPGNAQRTNEVEEQLTPE